MLVARALFFQCQPRPFEGEAGWQGFGQLDHGVHGVTGALSLGSRAGELHRRVAVVAGRLHLSLFPGEVGDGTQRNLSPLGVGDVQRFQPFFLHPRSGIGLHGHALQAAIVGEVVDVGGAEVGAEDVGDAADGNVLRVGGVTVDVDAQLRRVFQTTGADLSDHVFFLHRHAHELVTRSKQCCVSLSATVFQHQIKTAGCTE